jgi:hypothetical protein
LQILKLANLPIDERLFGLDGESYHSIEECQIANILYKNFIIYEAHKKVTEHRQWKCDFYLPEKDLWIEYDGLGKTRKSKKQWNEKLAFYRDNHYNLLVLNPKEDILIRASLKVGVLDRSEYRIIDITKHEANLFLQRVHYIGKCVSSDRYHFGIYRQSKLMGVITFGRNSNPHEKYLCLNRFAGLDIAPPNFGSYFMSRALKELAQNGHCGKVVTWHDPRFHNGGLYRACNFTFVGSKQSTDYIYIDKDGNEYHKSKCRVPAGQSEKEKAKELGLVRKNIAAKQRWEIEVGK